MLIGGMKGTDEAHLIQNHMGGKHKFGVSLPCINLGCSKMFNSAVSRDRHMKYCGVAKSVSIAKRFTKGGQLKKT